MAGNSKSGRKAAPTPSIPVMFRLDKDAEAKGRQIAAAKGLPFATWLRSKVTALINRSK